MIDFLTPSIRVLLRALKWLEAVLERSIAKDSAKLVKLHEAKIALEQTISIKNREIDSAYKVLNSVNGMLP